MQHGQGYQLQLLERYAVIQDLLLENINLYISYWERMHLYNCYWKGIYLYHISYWKGMHLYNISCWGFIATIQPQLLERKNRVHLYNFSYWKVMHLKSVTGKECTYTTSVTERNAPTHLQQLERYAPIQLQ